MGSFRKVNSRSCRGRAALLKADVHTALVSVQQAAGQPRSAAAGQPRFRPPKTGPETSSAWGLGEFFSFFTQQLKAAYNP